MAKQFVERVTSITQGISKQAASIRFPGQCDDATNIAFNVVDGARKRNGSSFLGFLSGALGVADYRMHLIKRDDQEQYIIVYGQGMFRVFDLVRLEQCSLDVDATAAAYIANATAANFRFTTIADVTFVANTRKPALQQGDGNNLNPTTMPMQLTRVSYSPDVGARFSLKAAEWQPRNFNYQIIERPNSMSGGTFCLQYKGDKTVPIPFDASADDIQKALEGNGFDENDFLVAEQRTVTTGQNSSTSTTRTEFTGQYINVDLPPKRGTLEGRVVEGLPQFNFGKVVVTGGPLTRQRVLIRISPDIEVDEAIRVVNNSTGRTINVKIGDPQDDPAPSFAAPSGTDIENCPRISDIAFIRNRLAISADEFVCFSRTDDVYSFFREEPPSLIASDAFDIQLSADDVCIIDRLTQFRSAVVMLTKSGQQFELSGIERLSATTAAVTATTKFDTQDTAPAKIGERMYIAAGNQESSKVLEYFFNNDALSNTAIDVTKHVADLLPSNIITIAANPNRETVYVATKLDDDVKPEVVLATCESDTGEMDWDLCTTWDDGRIPQPFDVAVIPTGCTVKRIDDVYAQDTCQTGLVATGPSYQDGTIPPGVCCNKLSLASRVPCACDGSPQLANCNCYGDTCPQCASQGSKYRLFAGVVPVITTIKRLASSLANVYRDRAGDLECTSGACCRNDLNGNCYCEQTCKRECPAGSFTEDGACSAELCACGGASIFCGCCCTTDGPVQGLNRIECTADGGTCTGNTSCQQCLEDPGGGGGPGEGDDCSCCCINGVGTTGKTPAECGSLGGTCKNDCSMCSDGGGQQPGDDFGDPTNENIKGSIFVYQTYVEGQERKQSAWARWLLGKDRVQDVVCLEDEVIVLRKQTLTSGGNILCIESIDVSDDRSVPVVDDGETETTWAMPVHLDHQAAIKGGFYSVNQGYTSWVLGDAAVYPPRYTDYEIDTAVASDGTVYPLQSIDDGQSIRTTANVDLTGQTLLIGRKVVSTVKLSETFARDPKNKSIMEGRSTLKKIVAQHTDTYSYDIVVASDENNALTRTQTFTNPTPAMVDGETTLYVQGNTEDTAITLQSDNPFPATFTSYEIYGILTQNITGGLK